MSDRPPLAVATWPALGTTAWVVTAASADLGAARAVVAEAVDRIDRACSRFRPDSELGALRPGAGAVPVSAVLCQALAAALRAARLTDGLVDPTVGTALRLLGYDRDFAQLADRGPAPVLRVGPVPGWRAVGLDPARRTVTLPAGVELDLGATAKALCADQAAAAAHAATGAGVLVSLGGDIATAGPAPPGGWPVQVSDDHARPRSDDPTVVIAGGGLATSSTTVRRWRRGPGEAHHIVDPAAGTPARGPWRTVTVAAASCVDANTAATAALVLGAAAPAWLRERRLPARLVDTAGQVVALAGWPADRAGAPEAAGR